MRLVGLMLLGIVVQNAYLKYLLVEISGNESPEVVQEEQVPTKEEEESEEDEDLEEEEVLDVLSES